MRLNLEEGCWPEKKDVGPRRQTLAGLSRGALGTRRAVCPATWFFRGQVSGVEFLAGPLGFGARYPRSVSGRMKGRSGRTRNDGSGLHTRDSNVDRRRVGRRLRAAVPTTTSTRPPRRRSASWPMRSAGDMRRAIKAARRAFDQTDWATNKDLRQRCLIQLHEALVADKGGPASGAGGRDWCSPIMVTTLAQLDGPLADGLLWPARMIDEFPIRSGHGHRHPDGHALPPGRVEGANGGGRRHRAVELPLRGFH